MALELGKGANLEIWVSGEYRTISVLGGRSKLQRWMVGRTRPSAAVMHATLKMLASMDNSQIRHSAHIYKKVDSCKPSIWEIKKGQVRLLCCERGTDIIIFHLVEKKRGELNAEDIQKARRLAEEVCKDG
ncbi:hypothetical protein J7K50_06730 [bacterium]|nr:hypothetical protein [bacterium]